MLYEEDFEDDHIDFPGPYDPDATARNIEEDSNIYDEYLGAELYFDIGPDGSPERGLSRKDSRGKTGGPLAMATTTHSSIQGSMRSRLMGAHTNMLPTP